MFSSNKEEGEHGERIPARRFLSKAVVTIFLVPVPLLIWITKTAPGNGIFNIINFQQTFSRSTTPTPTWVSVELESNYVDTAVSQWSCLRSKTANISIAGLDHDGIGNTSLSGGVAPIQLAAGEIHEFVITSLDEDGIVRCLGGDYFEVDLLSDSWKSRPPVKDHGDGRYTLYLQVHPDFTGTYILTITLLFRSFEAFEISTEAFIFHKEMRTLAIKFHNSDGDGDGDGGGDLLLLLPDLAVCTPEDFSKEVWNGRWTRHDRNDSCEISPVDGRFRWCLDPNISCHMPWCEGHVGELESNGWVYSAHCSFRIFTQADAWSCLNGKWLFFSGDSNHVDTISNLLHFVLGIWESVPRRFDTKYVNPNNQSEVVRITSVFNGHPNVSLDYMGLDTFRDHGFQDIMRRYFSEETGPDIVIFNSGLHDGVRGFTLPQFIEAAEYAADFWTTLFRKLTRKSIKSPAMLFRKTVAVGGYARDLVFNPHRMEVFNDVMVEILKLKGLLTRGGVIDDFDMTFPWHYDNRCADGVHYGRPPTPARWMDGGIGHQYFVDLMLVHVLLNAICN